MCTRISIPQQIWISNYQQHQVTWIWLIFKCAIKKLMMTFRKWNEYRTPSRTSRSSKNLNLYIQLTVLSDMVSGLCFWYKRKKNYIEDKEIVLNDRWQHSARHQKAKFQNKTSFLIIQLKNYIFKLFKNQTLLIIEFKN